MPFVETVTSVDNANDTNNDMNDKNLHLDELSIADLLVLFNIVVVRYKELSAEQKYECCIKAMKLVTALAPFVMRTKEFFHWM